MTPKIIKVGDWQGAARILKSADKRIKAAVDKAVLQEAQFFRTKIVEGIREEAPGGMPFTASRAKRSSASKKSR